MRRSLMLLLLSFLLFSLFSAAAVMSEAALGWLEGGIFPETVVSDASVEVPSRGAWFIVDEVWLREAENPVSATEQRHFVDVNGNWSVFDGSAGDLLCPVSRRNGIHGRIPRKSGVLLPRVMMKTLK